jgi:hypothetical protein
MAKIHVMSTCYWIYAADLKIPLWHFGIMPEAVFRHAGSAQHILASYVFQRTLPALRLGDISMTPSLPPSSARWLHLLSTIAMLLMVQNPGTGEDSPTLPRGTLRLREGVRVADVVGQFEVAGDRVSFAAADATGSWRVLENLALERIGRVLAENRANPQWVISGTITEYNGANYLLVTKAVQTGNPAAKDSPRKEAAGAAAGGIGTRSGVDYAGEKGK